MRSYFFFLLLLPLTLFANASSLTFDDLISTTLAAPPNNVEIEVRGFLYTAPDGRLILAAEPDLKTCCVGSSLKTQQQIILLGGENLPKTKRAITLKGTFFYTIQGDMPLYFMKNPVVIEENHRMEFALILLSIAIVSYYFLMSHRKQKGT